ncbi:MAG TPA: hypothetical protein VN249_04610, partial [Prolixibacteraceae bacterium]|nr:hypothetical protein [Prolixibacteraceae bacterium]
MKPTQSSNQIARRNFIRASGLVASGLTISPSATWGFASANRSSEEIILNNPTSYAFKGEPVRLKTDFLAGHGSIRVKKNGVEIPFQTEEIGNQKQIWVAGDFAPGISHKFEVLPGTPKSFPKKVSLHQESNFFILDNGKVSIKIPAQSNNSLPGPIASIKLANG